MTATIILVVVILSAAKNLINQDKNAVIPKLFTNKIKLIFIISY